jgi:hypothetical protein
MGEHYLDVPRIRKKYYIHTLYNLDSCSFRLQRTN